MQVVRLTEPAISMPVIKNMTRQFAARPIDAMSQ